jgi:tetratricopeptide (TPR) repeat protein
MSRPRNIALVLALATLAVYLPVAWHEFIGYDDDAYVTNNLMVQKGLTLAGLKWAFTNFEAANWHPLTWLSHMLDCELFDLNAGAQHFVNVLFHAANAALLFILFWRMTGLMQPAVLVAALFAWHPQHVESVAWIAERKDVLSTFFAMLALLSYVKFAREKNLRSYWFALIFFVLGLLAKPMLVTLPFLLLLLDYWPLNRMRNAEFGMRSLKMLLLEKVPFLVLAAGTCVVTVIAQRAGQAVGSLTVFPLSYRLENAVISVGRYLLKIFLPVNLSVNYPLEPISMPALALSAIALIVISFIVWRLRNRNRCWLAGWLWFLGTLVPVIGLVQVGHASMADRYAYVPSIGIFVALVFGLHEWCRSVPARAKIFTAALWLAPLVCILWTERQLSYWRNTETLFRHALAVTDHNDTAHGCLGAAFEQQGRITDAIEEYREALKANPHHYQLHYVIGRALEKLNQPRPALVEYVAGLDNAPQSAMFHSAASSALATLGNNSMAFAEIAEAERFDPNFAEPHLVAAKIYFQQGKDDQAKSELQAACGITPRDIQTLTTVAHYLAANADDTVRDGQTALALALKASDLSNNRRPEVFDVLGMAFAATGDFSNAVVCANNALEFTPAARLKDAAPIRQRRELYQNQKPWRESFRATNAPAAP